MGSGGSKHQILAVVHNSQDEHQSTVVESTGIINDVKLRILFDYGATDSFISWYALDKCVLASCKHNDFNLVEMASEIKQVVGHSVDNCMVDLGVCVTQVKVYVTSLGTYDLIIGMN